MNTVKIPTKELEKIDKAFDLATSEEDETHIARVGGILRQIDPSFDPRSFGYKNLSQLFENIEKYLVVKNEINGLNHPLVKLK
ncbi:OST-HTH/LOTUS domain-containing protein [Flavobacterium chuncheonense]|uniref:OST-HTH/LOTUS domain-containing protein n=1 Tax=Flavobacterium chuncheonense TaxID=2026653 RepID=A0ABW5YP26_9FLAO